MRRAQLADGTILEFPDETTDEVIDTTIKRVIAERQLAADATLTLEKRAPAFEPQAPQRSTQELTEQERIDQALQFNPVEAGQESMVGALETGLTLGTAVAAEPVAGVVGAATAPFIGADEATRNIEATREALTFQPRTEAGQAGVETAVEFLQPVGEAFASAEKAAGDKAFELTGSPAIAAFATTLPTVASELTGAAIFKTIAKAGRARKVKKFEQEIDKAIKGADIAPDQLKAVSSQIFEELEGMGVAVRPQKYQNLIAQIQAEMKGAFDVRNTPKTARVLRRMQEFEGRPVTLNELANLRKFAKTAAKTQDATEQRLGNIIIDNIDSFLTRSPETIFDKPARVKDVDISRRYNVARNLWGRAKKSELIDEIFDNARLSNNMEAELRNKFRSILTDSKPRGKRRFFNEEEIRAMKEIVKGTKTGNIARALGTLGFSPNQTTITVAQLIGGGGGFFFLGGIEGAAGLAALGTLSKYLSRLITEGKVKTLNAFIKAGPDGRKLTAAYLKNTPPAQRSARELAELLTGEGVDLSKVPRTAFADTAVEIAAENRRAILRGGVTGELARQRGED